LHDASICHAMYLTNSDKTYQIWTKHWKTIGFEKNT
jgi:hypothetical protein